MVAKALVKATTAREGLTHFDGRMAATARQVTTLDEDRDNLQSTMALLADVQHVQVRDATGPPFVRSCCCVECECNTDAMVSLQTSRARAEAHTFASASRRSAGRPCGRCCRRRTSPVRLTPCDP